MRDDVRIADAKPQDLEAIHAIESASFPAPWRIEFFAAELMASGRFNIVAKRGAAVIGYLL